MSLLALLLAKIQPLIYKILRKNIFGGLDKIGVYRDDLKLHNRAPSSENLEP